MSESSIKLDGNDPMNCEADVGQSGRVFKLPGLLRLKYSRVTP